MEKDHYVGIIVILGIIAVAILGGQKNALKMQSGTNTQIEQSTMQSKTITQQLSDVQKQTATLQKQIQAEQDAKTRSPYYGLISIQYVNRGNTPNYEYAVLHMLDSATTTAQITGWRIQSIPSGQGTNVPDGTEIFWKGQVNGTAPIVMTPGDTVYLITGISPVGYNFRIDKCSGYLSQFQTFIPYISTNCPLPRNENLSSIPKISANNTCFDYINSLQGCREQTAPLPLSLGYECINFITTKLDYTSCINTHKDDKDFFQKDWRVYLGRSSTLWQSEREDIILYDGSGKIVSELTY